MSESITLPIENDVLKVKAVTYNSSKTPLSIKEVEIPVQAGSIVKPTELLVQVKATSINPVDCIFKGLSNAWFGPKDKIIGGDFAGIVVKAGAETKFNVGDKIYGDVLSFSKRGSSSEFILFEPKTAIICEKIPEGMKFEEAGSLPIVSGTAYQCLNSHKGTLEGANVLVLGAGTSVGTYATQMAKYYFNAAKVVATCSPKSSEKITKCGADLIIDYTKGNTSKINELLEFVKTNGKFDIIVDTVRDESVFDFFDTILKPASENGILTQVEGSYTIDYTQIKLSQLLPSWKKLITQLKFKFGFSDFQLLPILLAPSKSYGACIDKLYKEGKLFFSIDSINDAYVNPQASFDKVASGTAKGKVVLKF